MAVQTVSNPVNSSIEQIQGNNQLTTEQIKQKYGRRFIKIVGVEQLARLPVLSLDCLRQMKADSLLNGIIQPQHLKGEPAGHITLPDRRIGLVINVEVMDQSQKVLTVVSEVIFKKHSLDGDRQHESKKKNIFCAATVTRSNEEEEGIRYLSWLSKTGSIRSKEIEAIRDLLKGETIQPPYQMEDENYYIRMQQQRV
jgi:hypothetical protein